MTASNTATTAPSAITDGLGVSVSTLCIIHCLATPLIIAILPGLAWMETEWLHAGLAVLAGIFLFTSMRHWAGHGKSWWVRSMGIVGLAGLLFGAFAEISETSEQVITVASAILLALAHILALFGRNAAQS